MSGPSTEFPEPVGGAHGTGRAARRHRFGRRPLFVGVVVVGVVTLAALALVSLRGGSVSPASAGGVAPDAPVVVSAPADRPLQVLFAGDSITDGAFALDPGQDAFPALVEDRLAQHVPVTVQKIGHIGYTTAMVLPAVAGAGQADVIVVELGTNDAFDVTLETFRSDYPALLDALRAQSPDAALVCAGAWHGSGLAREMDEVIAAECRDHGGRYAGLDALFEDPANHGPDGTLRLDGTPIDWFHPNDAGHAGIAEAVLAALDLSELSP